MLPNRKPAQARSTLASVSLASSLAFSLAVALGLSGCQTAATPEAETVLWLKLNDSLSRYESVLVQIVDRNDTNNVLATLWNKPLPAPSTDIQPFRLKTLADDDFIVRIMGYLAQGQLALHTQITYDGGKKSVLHKEVPPLIARDKLIKLTPSAGALSPAFNKDTATYTLNIDKDEVVTFSLAAENASATIAFQGETVASGSPTKAIHVTENTDTLTITVTDPSTSPPSRRTYTITVVPKPPPGLYLGSLVPSAGALRPPFSPETQIYSLLLPAGVDTIAFVVSPADPRTMTMTVAGKAVLPGQRSQTFKIEPNSSKPVPFEVFRGSESSFYQVTVDLYRAPLPK
jgi:hypothetical protein